MVGLRNPFRPGDHWRRGEAPAWGERAFGFRPLRVHQPRPLLSDNPGSPGQILLSPPAASSRAVPNAQRRDSSRGISNSLPLPWGNRAIWTTPKPPARTGDGGGCWRWWGEPKRPAKKKEPEPAATDVPFRKRERTVAFKARASPRTTLPRFASGRRGGGLRGGERERERGSILRPAASPSPPFRFALPPRFPPLSSAAQWSLPGALFNPSYCSISLSAFSQYSSISGWAPSLSPVLCATAVWVQGEGQRGRGESAGERAGALVDPPCFPQRGGGRTKFARKREEGSSPPPLVLLLHPPSTATNDQGPPSLPPARLPKDAVFGSERLGPPGLLPDRRQPREPFS